MIPNAVNVEGIRNVARVPTAAIRTWPNGLYAIYVGKLAPNKGTAT